ncbi:MAG TPA: MFS transporter [Pseudomonas sp.]|nr:MFS transporter [Pseudomonas sp.]
MQNTSPNPALDTAPGTVTSPAMTVEGDVIVRKVGRRVMWYLIALYVISVLDRGNLGFASFSMNRDLGLTPQMYSIGLGVLFLGYALFELPSNLALARFGARKTLTRIALAFGVVTISMAFVTGPYSFYLVRALLGIAEAGLTPGVFLYLSYWIPQHYRARYNARFTYAIPCAYVLASLISGLIMQLDGTLGIPGWKWLFVLEGLPALALGLFGIYYLTDHPRQAKWLSERERNWLQNQIESEKKGNPSGHTDGIKDLLKTRIFWLLALGYIGIFCGNACLGAWLPQILHRHDVPLNMIGILAALPPLAGVIGMTLLCRRSDLKNERIKHAIGGTLIAATGYCIVAFSNNLVVTLLGFMVANIGVYSSLAIFWSIPQTFLSAKIRPAAIALVASFGALFGGWLAPMAIGNIQTKTDSLSTGLGLVSLLFLVSAVCIYFVGRRMAIIGKS